MDDFFFGEDYKGVKGYLSYCFVDFNNKIKEVDSDYFLSQLERIMSNSSRNIDLDYGASDPDIIPILELLKVENIGKIHISLRDKGDVNDTTPTLDMSIYLKWGILRISPHWCAWKQMRAYEIYSTLLASLIKQNLTEKTFISSNKGKALKRLSSNPQEAAKQLFSLSTFNYEVNEKGEPL